MVRNIIGRCDTVVLTSTRPVVYIGYASLKDWLMRGHPSYSFGRGVVRPRDVAHCAWAGDLQDNCETECVPRMTPYLERLRAESEAKKLQGVTRDAGRDASDLFGRKTCKVCGKSMGSFIVASDRQLGTRRTCSKACRQKSYRDRKRAGE